MTDREVVLRLALAGTVEGENSHAALEERGLEGEELLLARIEAHRHEHDGRSRDSLRLAQRSDQVLAFVRNEHALARRIEVGQGEVEAFDRLHMRGAHLLHVLNEQILREMVGGRRAA